MKSIVIRGSVMAAVASIFVLGTGIATPAHAQQTAALAANPELAAKGVWNGSTAYVKDDIVTARGSSWIAKKASTGKVPGSTTPNNAQYWQLFARGFNPLGAWVNTTTYQPDDLVTFNGQTFRAKLTKAGAQPTANAFWELLVTKGADGATGATGPAGPNTGIGDGTSSAPSISFAGDPDTGIFHPAAGKIALVEDGVLFLHNNGGQNTALGWGSLQSNTGLDNGAFGHLALSSNTTGFANTAIGSSALFSNSTGSRNIAVGFSAMTSNTTGQDNVAVGYNAFSGTSSTGTRNIAIGSFTLVNNTASDNIGVGYQAMFANETGTNNVAVGSRALRNSTTADNTAIGYHALTAQDTGFSNTAVGSNTLAAATSGSANVAVGASALPVMTTGSFNVAIGLQALQTHTTGADNIAIGRNALAASLDAVNNVAIGTFALKAATQNGNTAIGMNALVNLNEGTDNIAIGVGAGNQVINSSGNILIAHNGSGGADNAIRIGTTGNHTTAAIAGIAGTTTGQNDAIPVLVDSNGQLGTVSSSRRYKYDIETMADVSAMLAKLHPVTFRYKKAQDGGQHPLQYGLIAEEVADVFPDLAVFKDGQPETVKYHLLPSFLLVGYQAQQNTITAQAQEIARLKERVTANEALEDRLRRLEALLPQTKAAALQ